MYSILALSDISAMDVVCIENAINMSLVYSGTKALLQALTGQGNLQGQETCGFQEAYIEFPLAVT